MLARGATLLMISCSKEKEKTNLRGDGTEVIVNVMGITDKTEVSAGKLKASTADMPAIKEGEIMPKELINSEAFDAQVSLSKDDLKKRPVSIGESVTSNMESGQLMAAAMD